MKCFCEGRGCISCECRTAEVETFSSLRDKLEKAEARRAAAAEEHRKHIMLVAEIQGKLRQFIKEGEAYVSGGEIYARLNGKLVSFIEKA